MFLDLSYIFTEIRELVGIPMIEIEVTTKEGFGIQRV